MPSKARSESVPWSPGRAALYTGLRAHALLTLPSFAPLHRTARFSSK
jgi:hypothetical protein